MRAYMSRRCIRILRYAHQTTNGIITRACDRGNGRCGHKVFAGTVVENGRPDQARGDETAVRRDAERTKAAHDVRVRLHFITVGHASATRDNRRKSSLPRLFGHMLFPAPQTKRCVYAHAFTFKSTRINGTSGRPDAIPRGTQKIITQRASHRKNVRPHKIIVLIARRSENNLRSDHHGTEIRTRATLSSSNYCFRTHKCV